MDNQPTSKELKIILDNLNAPERLDDHPWTKSQVVREYVANNPDVRIYSPGRQLAITISQLFRNMIPSTMPKHGKRLDTSWGQFGILASQYFAPFVYGTVPPNSLRDAGGRIDQAIRLFVFNKTDQEPTDIDLHKYIIVGEEAELIPVSTLSDWHTMGIQKLTEVYSFYEQRLKNGLPTLPHEDSIQPDDKKKSQRDANSFMGKLINRSTPVFQTVKKHKGWLISILIVLFLILIGTKAVRVVQLKNLVFDDLYQLENLTQTGEEDPGLFNVFTQAQELIGKTRVDFSALHSEVKPFLWMGRLLAWVPKYGGDLSQAKWLFLYVDSMLEAADVTIQGVAPVIDSMRSNETGANLEWITAQLVEVQPQLLEASAAMDIALNTYENIVIKRISPKIGEKLGKIDPWIHLFDDGLKAAIALPAILGAANEGPQTYVVLLQNEDELRATGGFITGVATIVLENGKILSFKVEDSYAVDNPDQFYPPAPWQLERYMAASHWVLRDSNWFADFPTTAKWVEMFIATSRNYTVDGVVAIDQESMRYLLTALGPITVGTNNDLVTADNLINYMRTSKSEVPVGDQLAHRKDFMADLAKAILNKLQGGEDIPWKKVAEYAKQALDQRHILVQVDNPVFATLVAQQNWDGAVHSKTSDYLLVVDSNLGFSKVNAVVREVLHYEVDLSQVESPTATLTVTHTNNATGQPECNIVKTMEIASGPYDGLINRCYLDYLRIFKPEGTELLDAATHSVPAAMIPWNEPIPAGVDILAGESFPGVTGFGTLLHVPGSKSVDTVFKFLLPPSVLDMMDDSVTYNLHVQKQPGTIAVPITIVLDLPENAQIVESSLPGKLENDSWTLITDLRQDIALTIKFQQP